MTQLKDFTHVSTLAAQTAPDHPGPVPPRVRLKLTTINPARGCSPAPQPLPYPRHPRGVTPSRGVRLSLQTQNRLIAENGCFGTPLRNYRCRGRILAPTPENARTRRALFRSRIGAKIRVELKKLFFAFYKFKTFSRILF